MAMSMLVNKKCPETKRNYDTVFGGGLWNKLSPELCHILTQKQLFGEILPKTGREPTVPSMKHPKLYFSPLLSFT